MNNDARGTAAVQGDKKTIEEKRATVREDTQHYVQSRRELHEVRAERKDVTRLTDV